MKPRLGVLNLLLAVGLAGFAAFYIIPLFASFSYTFDGGLLKNLLGMLQNEPFMRAIKNTVFFLAASVPCNIALSLAFAVLLEKSDRAAASAALILLLLPMAMPSSACVHFWKNFFAPNGFLNGALACLGVEAIDWLNSDYAPFAVVAIYLWKNMGFNVILFTSALYSIPNEYSEYARTEGASEFKIFTAIRLFLLAPILFAATLLSVVNSFKIFREIYLITGAYPSSRIYMLQHYLNNMFTALNYTRLSLASIIFLAILACILAALIVTSRLLFRRNSKAEM